MGKHKVHHFIVTFPEMMQSKDYHKQEMGVRSLEVLSVIKRRYWKEILDAGENE